MKDKDKRHQMEKKYNINGKVILLTGGTGSFGKKFVQIVLQEYEPKKLIIFSRDELKQFEMQHQFNEKKHKALRFLIGDVRDKERLFRALEGVDVVIHAAAMKQVPTAEYNPFEAIKTNVIGAQNIIDTTIDSGVERIIALSTDKAANPINLYGATKLCSDKLFIAANAYVGKRDTRFSVVRYGNVVGSRGSVIPFFLEKRKEGKIPITDERMTRFWITLEQGVRFVINAVEMMCGGELFVPKIPSMNIMAMARAIAPECEYETIGIRPGEKLHEMMISKDDARRTLEFDDYYVIEPANQNWWEPERSPILNGGKPCPEDFEYTSNNNDRWLDEEQLRALIERQGQIEQ
jgi:UDP-N-acetylglucosamine 4,6-dehydratase/5-epimerase